jgi:flavodoxin
MKKIGVFYWPKGGNVESCAQRIADRFKNQFEVQIYSLDTIKGLDLPYYDLVIVGGSIVNYGRFIRINNKLKYSIAEFGYNFLSWLKKV